MPSDQGLFRKEVVDSDGKHALGEIVLVYPISNYLMLCLALTFLAVLCIYCTVGTYTNQVSVSGVLEPSAGVVKLYAPQTGILKAVQVKEGQTVRKGDVVLVFQSEHASVDGQSVEQEVTDKLREQLNTLIEQRDGTQKLHAASMADMQMSLATLQANRTTLLREVNTQGQRVKSAEQTVAKFKKLQKAGFMPAMQTQQRIDDFMDQQQRLSSLQKDAATADMEIARITHELDNGSTRLTVALADIVGNISRTQTELARQQNNHEWSVRSPCDGVVSSLTVTHHQSPGVGVALVSIVPANSLLQAMIYAPSRALGFLRPGQMVKMKLDAFPYQKFGLFEGKVIAIADSPVRPSEVSPGTRLAPNGETGEALYTIRVALDKQVVDAYGAPQRLRPGMQLEAQIQLDTRRLYEWVLEPLYGMRTN